MSRHLKRPRLDVLPESKTVECVIGMIGRGSANISRATEIARCAQEDGLSQPALRALTSCGADGRHAQNTERDLHRWCSCLFGCKLLPYQIKLTLQAPMCEEQEQQTLVLVLGVGRVVIQEFQEYLVHGPPTQVEDYDDPQEVLASVLLPHEVAHAIAESGREQARRA